MRRRSTPTDSLELLLDTICNTFGGVLFIAILVVLLLQTTPDAAQTPETSPVQGVPQATAESQQQELLTLQRENDREEENLKAADELVDRLASAELKSLLEEKKKIEHEEARLQAVIEAHSRRTAEADLEASQSRQDLVDLERRKQSLEETKREMERRFDDVRSKQTFDIRLPKARNAPLKSEIGIIIRYGRMYLWHRYDSDLDRSGLNSEDFIVISETGAQVIARPDPTRGIRLDGSNEMKVRIKLLLKRFSTSECFMSFIVRSDSFAEFRHARVAVKEIGYEYRLMPGDDPVWDRGGSADVVQ